MGDLLSPFLQGAALDGHDMSYEGVWQKRNLVLFVLPQKTLAAVSQYLSAINQRLCALKPPDTALMISGHTGSSLPLNTLVIADRWGEIVRSVRLGSDPARWPPVDDIVEWVEFVRRQCPECPP
jgi:hypothetical protein